MMFNLMRMDFKRLLRQKSLYIILGITAAVVVLAMVTVVIIVNPEFRLQAQEAGMEILESDKAAINWMQSNDITFFMENMVRGNGFVTVICLISAIFIYGDFKRGYIKNILSVHGSRTHYIFSKIIVMAAVTAVTAAVTFLMIKAGIRAGNLEIPTADLKSYVCTMTALLAAGAAWAAQMIFIYVLTRSEGAAIAGAIIFPTGLLVTLLQSILSTIKMNSTFLNYTLFGITNKITDASGNFSIGVYIQCIAVPLAWLAFYAGLSILVLKKKDI